MELRMSYGEQNLLRQQLSEAQHYLEFGMGGSTIAAIESKLNVVSVESDQAWISKVEETIKSRFDSDAVRFKSVFVDIGPTREWGIPASKEKQHLWPGYFLSPWSHLEHSPDFVLVDGRFRTACFLSCLLALPASSKIAIHDFRNGDPLRHNYEKVLEFSDILFSSGTLFVMKRKAHFDRVRAMSALYAAMDDYW